MSLILVKREEEKGSQIEIENEAKKKAINLEMKMNIVQIYICKFVSALAHVSGLSHLMVFAILKDKGQVSEAVKVLVLSSQQ